MLRGTFVVFVPFVFQMAMAVFWIVSRSRSSFLVRGTPNSRLQTYDLRRKSVDNDDSGLWYHFADGSHFHEPSATLFPDGKNFFA